MYQKVLERIAETHIVSLFSIVMAQILCNVMLNVIISILCIKTMPHWISGVTETDVVYYKLSGASES